MSVIVSVAGDDPANWMPHLARELPGETHHWDDGTGDVLPDVDHAVVWGPKPALFARLPNVKAVFSLGAGVDHILSTDAVPAHLPVVRYVGDDLTARMGEWVALQCLHHLRQAESYRAAQAQRRWQPLDQPGAPAVTVGIMGLGVMGLEAARVLKALGFRLAGWSRTEKVVDGMACFAGREALPAFLAIADIVVSVLPLTPETRGLIDAGFIDGMRRDGPLGGPFLITAGRGKSQSDAAIADALADGRLKGASLDVFETEPLPADSPLWSAPNLVITPHAAAWSDRRDVVAYVARQVRAFRAGQPLINLVDRARGY